MSETIVGRIEIPSDEAQRRPDMVDRRVNGALADMLAAHLQANREAAIAYRLCVRKEDGREQPWIWRDVLAYTLYVEALHINYHRAITYPYSVPLFDEGPVVAQPEYVPLWKSVPNYTPPVVTRTVVKTVVKRSRRLGGFSTGALLREHMRRYRRRTVRFSHWLQRMAEPVDVPDRSRYEKAILDWPK